MQSVTTDELASTLAGTPARVFDVREVFEYVDGHIPGATNVPLALVPLRRDEFSGAGRAYVVCESGGRSAQATMFLGNQGIEVVNVVGGMSAWRAAGHEVVRGSQN